MAWASLALLCGAGVSHGATPAWTSAPPMSERPRGARRSGGQGAVYVLAGTGADGRPVAEVERFDGRAWARETVLPGHGLNAPAAAALGGAFI